MVVTNNGPNSATGVTVADPVPAGMTFVSATSSQGTCTGGALVSCPLGTMNVGSSVTITLVTTADHDRHDHQHRHHGREGAGDQHGQQHAPPRTW